MMAKVTAKQNFYNDALGSRMRGDVFDVESSEMLMDLKNAGYVEEGEHALSVDADTGVEAVNNQTTVDQPQSTMSTPDMAAKKTTTTRNRTSAVDHE